MKESNDIDFNFISYAFQSSCISIIKDIYEQKDNFENFLNIFNENFKKILAKRLEIFSFDDNLLKMNELIKKNKYYDFYKDGDEGEFFFILLEYIHIYKNFRNASENANLLYKNVFEFNYQNIFISDLMDNMNIGNSLPYIYIFDLHKIPFRRYIKSCYVEKNCNYSVWADLIEEDLKKIDNNIFLNKNKAFPDKFILKLQNLFHLS